MKNPFGVAVRPKVKRVYATYINSGTVSVIDADKNMVVGEPIKVGHQPIGVAVTPVYAAEQ